MSAIANQANGVVINGASGNTIGSRDRRQRHLRQRPERHRHLRRVVGGEPDLREQDRHERSSTTGAIAQRAGRHPHRWAPYHRRSAWRRTGRNIIGGNGQHGIGIYGGRSRSDVDRRQHDRLPRAARHLGNGLSGIHIDGSRPTRSIGNRATPGATPSRSNGRNGVTVLAGTGNRVIATRASSTTSVLGIDLGNDGVRRTMPATATSGRTTGRTSRC